jgi:hypothetical protein
MDKSVKQEEIIVEGGSELGEIKIGDIVKVLLEFDKEAKLMVYGGIVNGKESFLEQSQFDPLRINSWESPKGLLLFDKKGIIFSRLYRDLKACNSWATEGKNKLKLLKAAKLWHASEETDAD